jgi:hypothetical protein
MGLGAVLDYFSLHGRLNASVIVQVITSVGICNIRRVISHNIKSARCTYCRGSQFAVVKCTSLIWAWESVSTSKPFEETNEILACNKYKVKVRYLS